MFGLLGFVTAQSVFAMSYLGLYGVFVSILSTMFVLWLSLAACLGKFMLGSAAVTISAFKWFAISPVVIVQFDLHLDVVSMSFAFLTTTIALFVIPYAFVYFRYEPNVDRLIIMLSSFV
jgi:NADH:ubiquinone oxidoreductase subunit 5 (subunit L)/multisubunit Na+/H+ antiporter MnhA subunit